MKSLIFLKDIKTILLLSLILRLVFCFIIFPNFLTNFGTVKDNFIFDDYLEIAFNLVNGNGFSLNDGTIVFHRPPLYSILLTIPIFFENAFFSATKIFQILNIIFQTLSIIFVVKTVEILTKKHSIQSIVAGYSIAFWPFAIWITKTSIPENLLMLFVSMTIYFGLKFLNSYKNIFLILYSFSNALLYLTHASYLVFVFGSFMALVLSIGFKKMPRIIPRTAIIFLLVFFATIAPYLVRNYSYGFKSIKIATGFGLHYFKGHFYFQELINKKPYFKNLEGESANYANQIFKKNNLQEINTSLDRSNFIEMKKVDKLAVKHILENKVENILKVFLKTPLLWIRQQSFNRAILNLILILPLFYLAIKGAFRLSLNQSLIIILPLIFFNLLMSLVFIEDAPMRYALPIFPLLVILASKVNIKSY